MLSVPVDFCGKLHYNKAKMIFHTADARKELRGFFAWKIAGGDESWSGC